MNLRSKLGLFVLTRQEQRTIAFIVLAVMLGLITKHYRSSHPQTTVPNELKQSATPPASPPPATAKATPVPAND